LEQLGSFGWILLKVKKTGLVREFENPRQVQDVRLLPLAE